MIILMIILFVCGCATNQIKPIETIIHPDLPQPIQPYKFDWKVVVIDEKTVIVGLDYDQSLEFRLFLEDLKRYMKESNYVTCFYRKELNEPKCQQKVNYESNVQNDE